MSTDAIVVTYNRIEKLKECLSNLVGMDLKTIFVVNNASTDGTKEYLEVMSRSQDKIRVISLKDNIGGAGGFNVGLKAFVHESKSEYVWMMDDDTVPSLGALHKLLTKLKKVPDETRGFAVGQTYWINGELSIMNKPHVVGPSSYLSNTLEIDEASFVAILLYRKAILKIGLPIKDFFIWGDDVEYTRRLINKGFMGIQILDARVIHKMAANNSTNIVRENNNVERVKRYYYDFRNRIYLSKQVGTMRLLKTLFGRFIWLFRILFYPGKYKSIKVKVLYKGTIDGLRFKPKIESVS
ncbi:glycosyltransferase [Levilactobacillus spicheri]|uniref:Glycosyltransferase 2-like domain-containing protein n=1 Tax=Levilactobacillus spicheri TaxID=216463 RepID=A0A0F3RNX1_9LACO|nr:glycosyltransferase [Levilactobacillus spicheri]KJW11651.1 hypothetical protein VC81_12705 [Levilactobacillus spicheri]